VIAVFEILAALLLPVLNRAKETARSVNCLSNMRQLGIATMTYGMDNNGRLPVFWEWLHALNGSRTDLTTGLLYPHLKSRESISARPINWRWAKFSARRAYCATAVMR